MKVTQIEKLKKKKNDRKQNNYKTKKKEIIGFTELFEQTVKGLEKKIYNETNL